MTDKAIAAFVAAIKLDRHDWEDWPKDSREAFIALQAAQPEPVEPAYTTGHCENRNRPNGCNLHNLQCGYPACDRKLASAKGGAV